MSGLPADRVVAYLDSVYSNPRYEDFDVATAIELAAMRGADLKSQERVADILGCFAR
jgi:hypothetical protein